MRRIVYAICLMGLVLAAGLGWTEITMAGVETPKYTVERSDGAFEVRRYPALLIARTTVTGERSAAANSGFRTLADFIFGGNSADEKIAMTAPVIQTPVPGPGPAWTLDFVMPSAFNTETLPKPKREAVDIRTEPAQRFAAVRFSGFASRGDVEA